MKEAYLDDPEYIEHMDEEVRSEAAWTKVERDD